MATNTLNCSQDKALRILNKYQIALMITVKNVGRDIENIILRIPTKITNYLKEIYIIDDSSTDDTYQQSIAVRNKFKRANIFVCKTPHAMGYGGVQKIGFIYALNNGFDFMITLDGNEDHPPEYLPKLIASIEEHDADLFFASRITEFSLLRGNFRFSHIWLSSRIVTWCVRKLSNVNFYCLDIGYRVMRIEILKNIPFQLNANDFKFNTDIFFQLLSSGTQIVEQRFPMGNEINYHHKEELLRRWYRLKAAIKYQLFRMGLFYNPLLDFNLFNQDNYYLKKAHNSLHQYIIRQNFSDKIIADLGSSKGYISNLIAKTAKEVIAIDFNKQKSKNNRVSFQSLELDEDFDAQLGFNKFDTVLALDIIEHLKEPEAAVQKISKILKPGGKIFASTGNISFIIIRIMLLFGFFNYGKRGILDLSHRRLFTIYTFKKLFMTYGFEIVRVKGFGPPIRDLISDRWPFVWIDALFSFLATLMPKLFSYSFLLEAKRLPSLAENYKATIDTKS